LRVPTVKSGKHTSSELVEHAQHHLERIAFRRSNADVRSHMLA